MKWKYIELQENNTIDKHKNKSNICCSLCRSKLPDFLLIFSIYVKILKRIKEIKNDFHTILS